MDAENLQQRKREICEIGRRIWQKGFCAGNEGNHSIRLAPDRFLCTPTGMSKGFLEPDDLVVVDRRGEQTEPNPRGRRPTSEVKVHLAIYRRRPDAAAVIHSHPPHATAFAIAGVPLPEGVYPEAEIFLGKVRTAPYATPSTQDLPDSLLPFIDEHTNSLLMANHGCVCFGPDLQAAYDRLEVLDAYCRILLLVTQLGRVNVLSDAQVLDLLKIKAAFGMGDSRLAEAGQGGLGRDNAAFLSRFGTRP